MDKNEDEMLTVHEWHGMFICKVNQSMGMCILVWVTNVMMIVTLAFNENNQLCFQGIILSCLKQYYENKPILTV